MGQRGGTGQRPVLATCFGFLLCFTLTLFLQNFELRNFPQTTTVYFIVFYTLLTPSTGTINCFPTTQLPTQATRPFRAFPVTHCSIPIVPKPSPPQLSDRRPFVVDLLFEISPRPILWQKWLDQLSESGSQVSPTTNLKPHSFPTALEPILAYLQHPLASWASWSQSLLVLDGSKLGRTASKPFSSPHGVKLYQPWSSIGLNVLHSRIFVAL
jgi:hypothetical protein